MILQCKLENPFIHSQCTLYYSYPSQVLILKSQNYSLVASPSVTPCRVHRVPAAETAADMGAKTFTRSSASHSQEMLEKLNALRTDGHLCDVTIRVQDKLFLAHKVVLACCSDFFRSKLLGRPENNDDDDDKSVLDLDHVTVSGFAPLLD